VRPSRRHQSARLRARARPLALARGEGGEACGHQGVISRLDCARVRVLFLDIDGVLNRTGYRPVESLGLRSWIEPELAARLSQLLRVLDAGIVLASDWRSGRELKHLAEELLAAGVDATLLGATPVLGQARWREIAAYMSAHDLEADHVVIVDDGFDMGPLGARFVRASPLNGLDEEAATAIVALFERSGSA
jgi:hypothetical protein